MRPETGQRISRLVATASKKISLINNTTPQFSRRWSEANAYQKNCPYHIALSLFAARIAFAGMSAALRVPLRACANPATVIGQPLKGSFTASASFHTHSKSVVRNSPFLFGNTVKSWSPRQNWVKPISPSSQRSFASRTATLLSAEASSLKGNASEVKSSPAQRNYVKYLVVLGLLGVGAFAFSDNVKHIYGAARRSGRVVGTLAVCINE